MAMKATKKSSSKAAPKKAAKKNATRMSRIAQHKKDTKALAASLVGADVQEWLLTAGYYPEAYVLPPCFRVVKYRTFAGVYYPVPAKKKFSPERKETINVHYPKTELTDRNFGIIHPHIHHDIAYVIGQNWSAIVDAMIPDDSIVSSYAFPIPIDKNHSGRVGHLRSGRMIYEFIQMTDSDIAAEAYRFTHIVIADIKRFYPSIYTHSIAWALHGKQFIRQSGNFNNSKLLGNRLDKLFQNASDGCTNGIPIGPAVSDVAAEIIAAAVDRSFTKRILKAGINCEAVRFKDDYRILVSSDTDGKHVIKMLQASLKEYNLDISDEKTSIYNLPDGLFRKWVSLYHATLPVKLKSYSWKRFRELYLAVLRIDKECPNTGVVDRFLADISTKDGQLKVQLTATTIPNVVSMLLILATLRVKAFPKILALIEGLIRSPLGKRQQAEIVQHLEKYLNKLASDEDRNQYSIAWVCYFLASNKLMGLLSKRPKFKHPITRSVMSNRGLIFKGCPDFKVFEGCSASAKRVTMFQHLDVFDPPSDQ